MASEISGISECLLCGEKFTGPTSAMIVEPGRPKNRVMRYYESLVNHLMQKHRDQLNEILVRGEEFKGMLYLLKFRTTDTDLRNQRDFFRWLIHQQTLDAHVTDQNIEKMVTDLAAQIVAAVLALIPVNQTVSEAYALATLFADITERVQNILKPAITAVRDALEEPGKYPSVPAMPAQKPVN